MSKAVPSSATAAASSSAPSSSKSAAATTAATTTKEKEKEKEKVPTAQVVRGRHLRAVDLLDSRTWTELELVAGMNNKSKNKQSKSGSGSSELLDDAIGRLDKLDELVRAFHHKVKKHGKQIYEDEELCLTLSREGERLFRTAAAFGLRLGNLIDPSSPDHRVAERVLLIALDMTDMRKGSLRFEQQFCQRLRAVALNNLATVLAQARRFVEAIERVREARSVEAELGPAAESPATTMFNEAQIYLLAGRSNESIISFNSTIQVLKHNLSHRAITPKEKATTGSLLLTALRQLSGVCEATRRYDDAVNVLEDAILVAKDVEKVKLASEKSHAPKASDVVIQEHHGRKITAVREAIQADLKRVQTMIENVRNRRRAGPVTLIELPQPKTFEEVQMIKKAQREREHANPKFIHHHREKDWSVSPAILDGNTSSIAQAEPLKLSKRHLNPDTQLPLVKDQHDKFEKKKRSISPENAMKLEEFAKAQFQQRQALNQLAENRASSALRKEHLHHHHHHQQNKNNNQKTQQEFQHLQHMKKEVFAEDMYQSKTEAPVPVSSMNDLVKSLPKTLQDAYSQLHNMGVEQKIIAPSSSSSSTAATTAASGGGVTLASSANARPRSAAPTTASAAATGSSSINNNFGGSTSSEKNLLSSQFLFDEDDIVQHRASENNLKQLQKRRELLQQQIAKQKQNQLEDQREQREREQRQREHQHQQAEEEEEGKHFQHQPRPPSSSRPHTASSSSASHLVVRRPSKGFAGLLSGSSSSSSSSHPNLSSIIKKKKDQEEQHHDEPSSTTSLPVVSGSSTIFEQHQDQTTAVADAFSAAVVAKAQQQEQEQQQEKDQQEDQQHPSPAAAAAAATSHVPHPPPRPGSATPSTSNISPGARRPISPSGLSTSSSTSPNQPQSSQQQQQQQQQHSSLPHSPTSPSSPSGTMSGSGSKKFGLGGGMMMNASHSSLGRTGRNLQRTISSMSERSQQGFSITAASSTSGSFSASRSRTVGTAKARSYQPKSVDDILGMTFSSAARTKRRGGVVRGGGSASAAGGDEFDDGLTEAERKKKEESELKAQGLCKMSIEEVKRLKKAVAAAEDAKTKPKYTKGQTSTLIARFLWARPSCMLALNHQQEFLEQQVREIVGHQRRSAIMLAREEMQNTAMTRAATDFVSAWSSMQVHRTQRSQQMKEASSAAEKSVSTRRQSREQFLGQARDIMAMLERAELSLVARSTEHAQFLRKDTVAKFLRRSDGLRIMQALLRGVQSVEVSAEHYHRELKAELVSVRLHNHRVASATALQRWFRRRLSLELRKKIARERRHERIAKLNVISCTMAAQLRAQHSNHIIFQKRVANLAFNISRFAALIRGRATRRRLPYMRWEHARYMERKKLQSVLFIQHMFWAWKLLTEFTDPFQGLTKEEIEDGRKSYAAVRIQSRWRSHMYGRKWVRELQKVRAQKAQELTELISVISIQRWWHRAKANTKLRRLKEQEAELKQSYLNFELRRWAGNILLKFLRWSTRKLRRDANMTRELRSNHGALIRSVQLRKATSEKRRLLLERRRNSSSASSSSSSATAAATAAAGGGGGEGESFIVENQPEEQQNKREKENEEEDEWKQKREQVSRQVLIDHSARVIQRAGRLFNSRVHSRKKLASEVAEDIMEKASNEHSRAGTPSGDRKNNNNSYDASCSATSASGGAGAGGSDGEETSPEKKSKKRKKKKHSGGGGGDATH